MTLSSPAFTAGDAIPRRFAYQGEGQNVSPPLQWQETPPQTRAFALVCDDPDAPSPLRPRPKPWVHWVLYDLPADCRELREASLGLGKLGINDFGELGWGGPMPPAKSGKHRYVFTLYALSRPCGLGSGASKETLLEAIKDAVLAQASLIGSYERP